MYDVPSRSMNGDERKYMRIIVSNMVCKSHALVRSTSLLSWQSLPVPDGYKPGHMSPALRRRKLRAAPCVVLCLLYQIVKTGWSTPKPDEGICCWPIVITCVVPAEVWLGKPLNVISKRCHAWSSLRVVIYKCTRFHGSAFCKNSKELFRKSEKFARRLFLPFLTTTQCPGGIPLFQVEPAKLELVNFAETEAPSFVTFVPLATGSCSSLFFY
jgi:hypothetical protein